MRSRDKETHDAKGSRRDRSRDPESIADALGGVLSALDLDLAAPIGAIGDNWTAIVGSEVAAHCRPVGVKGRVLHADVDSSVWCQQLQMRSPQILGALKKFLGEAAPTDLRLRVGYSRPLPEDGGSGD